MSKWAALAKQTAAVAEAEAVLARRIGDCVALLHREFHNIIGEFNAAQTLPMLQLRLSEASFSGFRLYRADKTLTAVIASRPSYVEITFIEGYAYDNHQLTLSISRLTPSPTGVIVFHEDEKRQSIKPGQLADYVCGRVAQHSAN